jgi:hypothetical protein
VDGNKKGIFTRDRGPKATAHFDSKCYWQIAEDVDSETPPGDVEEYDYTLSWKNTNTANYVLEKQDISLEQVVRLYNATK